VEANQLNSMLSTLPETLITSNLESWQWIDSSFEKDAARLYYEWMAPLSNLIKQIRTSGLAKLFRAGRSLRYLIISTAEQHGLEPGQPFVSSGAEGKAVPPTIEYWVTDEKAARKTVPVDWEQDVFPLVESFLLQLWNDTR